MAFSEAFAEAIVEFGGVERRACGGPYRLGLSLEVAQTEP